MRNILVIAPDSPAPDTVRTEIMSALRAAGFALVVLRETTRCPADEIASAFRGCPPDLILADLRRSPDCLPMRHLESQVRQTWGDTLTTPPRLLLLTPRHLKLPDWMIHGDDFLLPPHTADEAVARANLLLFRSRHVDDADTIRFAGVTLNLLGGVARATHTGQALPLTPREYRLLEFLITHRGRFFNRERLLDLVWGVYYEGGARTVDIHIRRLRAKLPDETTALLETRRGIGYGFALP